MLDFRSKSKVRNYLARGEQRRLLVLVLLFGLTVLAFSEAGRADRWQWLWAISESRPAQAQSAEPIDTRLASRGTVGLPADAIVVEGPAPAQVDAQRRLLPGIDPAWLAAVRDDMHLRSAEHEAFYSLLSLLKRTDEAALDKAAKKNVGYVQLFKQTDEYRGELVSLSGTVRRAEFCAASKNDQGIEGFFKLVVQPHDHPEGLIFVDCTELPEQFPLGESVRAEAVVTGLCFKRWAYAAQGDLRTAPLLLAKTVGWSPPVAGPRTNWTPMVAVGLLTGLLCGGVVVYALRPARRSPAPKQTARDAEVGATLAALADSQEKSIAAPPHGDA